MRALGRRGLGRSRPLVRRTRCEVPSGRSPASSASWPGPLSLLARSGDRGRRPANGFAPHLRQPKRASRLGGEFPGLRRALARVVQDFSPAVPVVVQDFSPAAALADSGTLALTQVSREAGSVAGPRCEDPSGRSPASSVSWPGPSVFSRGQAIGVGDLRTASRHACVNPSVPRGSVVNSPGLRPVQLARVVQDFSPAALRDCSAGLQSCRALAEGPLR